jgi:hypothetical protein
MHLRPVPLPGERNEGDKDSFSPEAFHEGRLRDRQDV